MVSVEVALFVPAGKTAGLKAQERPVGRVCGQARKTACGNAADEDVTMTVADALPCAGIVSVELASESANGAVYVMARAGAVEAM